MASYSFTYFLLISFLLSHSDAQPFSSSRPRGVVLPFHKDPSTHQYVTEISLATPKVPIRLVLDLGGKLPWIHCGQKQQTSSYQPVDCKSPQCLLASSNTVQIPQCCNKTCSISSTNTVTRSTSSGQLGSDDVTLQSGYEPGQRPYLWIRGENVTARRFAFGCGTTSLNGLAKGVNGMAGLGRSGLSLVSQFSAAFHFSRKFALDFQFGNVYFGGGHYIHETLRPSFIYTPLISNPYNQDYSTDYYIGVKSIQIDGENVAIHKKMLSINRKNGVGGTKFSTLLPYTAMETSIYKAFTSLYVKRAKAMNITRAASVKPFGACFNSSTMVTSYPEGLVVPQVNLVLTNNVVWRVVGAKSSLKYVNDNVLCLGFIDGGLKARTSIVIGGLQLQDNLLEFDIPKSRVGFSQPLYQLVGPTN
ncbi:basic 7S globulin-like [Papaver somniferum]|uniref:basic 7S globulin-like n=1 Tax=Papaver somniferum TaxID=3469 RepID=UPI000E705AAC|nr:basic 7S globulin-like [Papaver somniferum]